jgi:hypothetical protein
MEAMKTKNRTNLASRKPRSDSPLWRLPPALQRELVAYMDEHGLRETNEWLIKQAVRTSVSALSRFRIRYEAMADQGGRMRERLRGSPLDEKPSCALELQAGKATLAEHVARSSMSPQEKEAAIKAIFAIP